MKGDASDKGLTLANKITIARGLSVPVVILLLSYYLASAWQGTPNEYLRVAGTVLFALAGLSDALDGYYARVRGDRTRLGTLLDPLADKALLLSGIIVLSGPWGAVFKPSIPMWYMLMVISRDALLIMGIVVIHVTVGHAVVRARAAGKGATFFQMLIIVWVLVGGPESPFIWPLLAATACTLVSTVQYVIDGVRQLEKAYAHDEAREQS